MARKVPTRHTSDRIQMESAMQVVIELLELLRRFGAKLGPYVLLELLLPGGTLFALLLFVHQRLKANAGTSPARPVPPPALVSALYEAPAQCNRLAASPHAIAAFV
jgi:hypothetical protein